MRGLADFFGGRVIYQDCGSSEYDYWVDERPDIHASDGDEWHRLQDRKLSVVPLTKKVIEECRKFAAYKEA